MTKNSWGRLAIVYPIMRTNPVSSVFLKKEMAAIYTLLRPITVHSFKDVADLGSGRGHSLAFLPESTGKKIAIDSCSEMIARTQSRFPTFYFIEADVCTLPLKPASLDFISCIGLLEYIPDADALLSQIHAVLKKERYLLLTNSPPGLLTTLRKICGPHLYPRQATDLEQIICSHDFIIKNRSVTSLQHQYLVQKL